MKRIVAKRRRKRDPIDRLLRLCKELPVLVETLREPHRREFLAVLRHETAIPEIKDGKLISHSYYDPRRILRALTEAAASAAAIRLPGRPRNTEANPEPMAIAYRSGLAWFEIFRTVPRPSNQEFQALIENGLRAAHQRVPADMSRLTAQGIKAAKSRPRTVRLLDRGQKRAA